MAECERVKDECREKKYTMVRSVRKEQRENVILKCSDGIQTERVETMKYLGIVIDNEFRFKDHCDYRNA